MGRCLIFGTALAQGALRYCEQLKKERPMSEVVLGVNGLDLVNGIILAKRSTAAVLISGETGTGKSTLAECIHQEGIRRNGPFVTVNLASLHEATIEATLFGHERGAFTGADRARVGRFELADKGTVFLDEIAELSLPLQARLLEFLQRRTIVPLGSHREKKVDVRVICATNRRLDVEVAEGRFREDLFHRIRVLNLQLCPLRELEGEMFASAIHSALEFANQRTGNPIHRLTKEVAELFECYSWPGNYRELENVLEVSFLSATDLELGIEHLPRWFIDAARAEPSYRVNAEVHIRPGNGNRETLASAEVPVGRSHRKTMWRFETAILQYYISRHEGNLARAARETGLSRATFYRKAEAHGLLASF